MSVDTIIEGVKSFISTFPGLSSGATVLADFLGPDGDQYSIEEEPAQTILTRYVDGSSSRQYVFVFAARFPYSDEIRQNIDNCGFYEAFADWMEEQSESDNLPEMPAGKTPTGIEAMSSGYLFDIAGDMRNARYQIQCRLLYDQE